ncbi:MAG TPA: GNAT family N-acetyltransferase [Kofleriaceae bacterium]|nr:GNAT family N-acetyltransferase [Kofleriaceae bacterium]
MGLHDGPLAALQADWARLVDAAHPAGAFRTSAWIASWWNHGSTSREPYVLVARDAAQGGQVVGILPLYTEATSFGGRRARLMGDGIVGSDYLGVIARPEDAERVSDAAADALLSARLDELQLDDLIADDPLTRALRDRAPHDALLVEPRYRCPFVRVAGRFEDYLAELPDGIGAQWHRRRKWLEKRPGYRLEVLSTPAEIDRGMAILVDLHRQRWALEGGSDAIDGPKVESFHQAAAHALAELGWARLFVLSADGAPRAALYGWRHGDRFAFYQAGHEPAWRPRSVGTVLLGFVIQHCFDEKLNEFDFLRGEEPYKLRWATGWRQTERLRVRGAGLRPWLIDRGRTWVTQLRGAAKRALPEPAVAFIRSQRRALNARLSGGSR